MRAARRRRATRPASAPRVVATIAMFQPEIATTWLAPTAVNAAARSRSTRSRSPMRIPDARPASGSGIARPSAASAPRRRPSRVRARVARGRDDLDRPRPDDPGRPDPREVGAVLTLGAGLELAVDRDVVAGDHDRPGREGRGEARRGRAGELHDGGPVALPERPDAHDHGRPRTVTGGQGDIRGRERRRRHEQPDGERAGPGRDRDEGQAERPPAGDRGHEPAHRGERAGAQEDGHDEPGPRSRLRTRGASAAPTAPTASRPLMPVSGP